MFQNRRSVVGSAFTDRIFGSGTSHRTRKQCPWTALPWPGGDPPAEETLSVNALPTTGLFCRRIPPEPDTCSAISLAKEGEDPSRRMRMPVHRLFCRRIPPEPDPDSAISLAKEGEDPSRRMRMPVHRLFCRRIPPEPDTHSAISLAKEDRDPPSYFMATFSCSNSRASFRSAFFLNVTVIPTSFPIFFPFRNCSLHASESALAFTAACALSVK